MLTYSPSMLKSINGEVGRLGSPIDHEHQPKELGPRLHLVLRHAESLCWAH